MYINKYFVYIMASGRNGTLYTGITNDIYRRDYEHKNQPQGFVKKYKVDRLVYYKMMDTAELAIRYEKKLKSWKRKWKIELIEKDNSEWKDLSELWKNKKGFIKITPGL